MKEQNLQELVLAYCDEPVNGLRHAIITRSMPLVKSIIGKINRPDTPLSQFEDLESAGIIGLLEALESYDPEKNIKFNTFAYYRIRGNIIDYLRKIDKLPRLQRSLVGKAYKIMEQLRQKLGREPHDEEVADELEIGLDEYRSLLCNVQQRSLLSLDDKPYDDDDGAGNMLDYIPNPEAEQPDMELDQKSESQILKSQIVQLDERDRLILTLYYFEDLTLNEIAMLLGLSEARISQVIGKLLLQLRAAMTDDILA